MAFRFQNSKVDWGELWTEQGELGEMRKVGESQIWQPGLSGLRKEEKLRVRDAWPQHEQSEAGKSGDCCRSILKRTRQQVSGLGWLGKKTPKTSLYAPLAPGIAPSVCESHWRPLSPLIPIHTSTGNLLPPPSTSATVVRVAETRVMGCFRRCCFWESTNAKMPKTRWWNLN